MQRFRCLWLDQLPPNWPIDTYGSCVREARAMILLISDDIPPPHTNFGKIPGRYWNPCQPIIGKFWLRSTCLRYPSMEGGCSLREKRRSWSPTTLKSCAKSYLWALGTSHTDFSEAIRVRQSYQRTIADRS